MTTTTTDRITRQDIDRIAATITEGLQGYTLEVQGRNGYFGLDLYRDDVCLDTLTIGTKRELYLYMQGMRRAQLLARAAIVDESPDLIERARQAGYDHGTSAGGWVIDGNTTQETARAILDGIKDGDPAILDQLPSSPLSGEWADGPTPNTVCADLGIDPDSDQADEALDAYEEGFDQGVTDEVQRAARYITE